MLDARTIAEWTGRRLADHRDEDVVRWNIARHEAGLCMERLKRKAGGQAAEAPVQVGLKRRRGLEVMRASARVPGSFNALAAMTGGDR